MSGVKIAGLGELEEYIDESGYCSSKWDEGSTYLRDGVRLVAVHDRRRGRAVGGVRGDDLGGVDRGAVSVRRGRHPGHEGRGRSGSEDGEAHLGRYTECLLS